MSVAQVSPRGSLALQRRDVVWSFAGAAATAGGGFAFAWLVARALGPAGSGVVLSFAAWFVALSVIGKIGMDTALVWATARWVSGVHHAEPRQLLRWALLPSLGFSGLLALAGVLWAGPIAEHAFNGALTHGAAIVALGALGLPLSVLTILLLAMLRGLGNARPMMAIDQVLKPLSRLALAAGVLVVGATTDDMVLAWLASVPLCLAAALAAARSGLRGLPRTAGDPQLQQRSALRRFAGPRWLAQSIDVVGLSVGTLVLSVVATPAETGLFATALRVVLIGQLALTALRMLIAPLLAHDIARGELQAAQSVYRGATVLVVGTTFPLYLGMLAAPAIVLQIFGPDFTAATSMLAVMAVGAMLQAAMGNLQSAVLMSGRSGVALWATAAALATNLALIVTTYRWLGGLSAAVGWSVGVCAESAILARFAQRDLQLRPLGRAVLATVALTTVVWVPAWLAAGWLWQRSVPLALLALLGASAVFALCWGRQGLRAWRELSSQRKHQPLEASS